MPTFTLDGQEFTVDKGKTIIQVCDQMGIDVPRYCYHPGLRVVGSCRMCMVEVEKMPKLQIACNTQVQDGMVVWTQTPKVKEARRSVLEFLLLNHPLDCPVCDRAGECELQNYYMKHGLHNSRLRENKIKKKKAFPIGKFVILDQERCVLCSRCVRFTEEISKTGELGIFNRAVTSEVNVYPGRELDNRYSGNVVDICPVGALLDRDFRYQMSVWYLKETNSICPGCANGCNTRIHFNLDRRYKIEGRRVLRLKPRFNEHVNKWWLCDEGRYYYKWIDVDRIEAPLLREPIPGGHEGPLPENGLKPADWDALLAKIAENIKLTIDMYGPDSIGVIASPQMTNEELYVVRKIFSDQLKVSLIRYHIPPKPEASEDNFLIKKDKNPNTRGAELIFDSQKDLPVRNMLEAAKNGKVKLLYVFHTDLADRFGADMVREAFRQINAVIFHGTNKSTMLDFATHVLPAATYAEIEGTFTNFQGRVQRIFPAFAPLAESRATLRILRDLAQQLGITTSVDASMVFQELRSHIPAFGEMDYASIGLAGKVISQPASAAANP